MAVHHAWLHRRLATASSLSASLAQIWLVWCSQAAAASRTIGPVQQVEYYLSEANLRRDWFLRQHLEADPHASADQLVERAVDG